VEKIIVVHPSRTVSKERNVNRGGEREREREKERDGEEKNHF
jgi:hypothetical protein